MDTTHFSLDWQVQAFHLDTELLSSFLMFFFRSSRPHCSVFKAHLFKLFITLSSCLHHLVMPMKTVSFDQKQEKRVLSAEEKEERKLLDSQVTRLTQVETQSANQPLDRTCYITVGEQRH